MITSKNAMELNHMVTSMIEASAEMISLENGEDDPFYSETNMKRIEKATKDMDNK